MSAFGKRALDILFVFWGVSVGMLVVVGVMLLEGFNDTTGDFGSGVSGGLACKIIPVVMDNNRASHYIFYGEKTVIKAEICVAVVI